MSFALREFRRLTSSHCPLKLSSDFWGHLRKPKCRSPYPLTRCWCSGLPGQALKPRSKKYNNCGLLGRLQQEADSLWHLEAITKSIRFFCTVSTCQVCVCVCVSVILAYPNMNLPSKREKKKHSRWNRLPTQSHLAVGQNLVPQKTLLVKGNVKQHLCSPVGWHLFDPKPPEVPTHGSVQQPRLCKLAAENAHVHACLRDAWAWGEPDGPNILFFVVLR